jgi:hypothetical protein
VGLFPCGYLTGQQGANEIIFSESRAKAYVRRTAGHPDKVGMVHLFSFNGQRQSQVIQEGNYLANAEISNRPVFELIKGSAGYAGSTCQLRLCKATRNSPLSDLETELLDSHENPYMLNILNIIDAKRNNSSDQY